MEPLWRDKKKPYRLDYLRTTSTALELLSKIFNI